MSERLHIALLGAGQLGGSFVLALRENGADIFVSAYDPATAHAETLRARGAVDAVATTPAEAAHGADIIVLAAPLGAYRALAQAIAPQVENGAIVTDLGSVKGSMVAVARALPQAHTVPAHPIAGSEKSGPDAARADLFAGKLCILTPDETTDAEAFRAIEALWQLAGAEVIAMPHEVHDQIYAYVSHLPHIIAFVAAHYFHTRGITLAAEDVMLGQFLRIARSNPRMWTDIALENRAALLPALATYIALLEHFAGELRAGDPGAGAADANILAKTLLPRVLAASLISGVSLYEQQSGMNLRPFGAGGLRDMVAPAAISPEADTEAMSANAAAMAGVIEGILPHLRTLEAQLGSEDAPALYAGLSEMAETAHTLNAVRN